MKQNPCTQLRPLSVTFKVDQTVDHYVPVDTDSVIHKLRAVLVHRYKWCVEDEHNSSQPHDFLF